ncbi:MAG: extracellular solute-binding protein [Proteobacteria bacterium]|nr:extracellular solute-binding protein [Pseudomonadota bacterium]MDA1070198.1 extracellular solute-binding protein [Pseudomonadota bacterium]
MTTTSFVDDMIEKASRGKLSRRQMHQLLGLTGVSLMTVPALARPAAADGEEAFYFTWGGYDVPELLGEYHAKHGAYPDMAPYGSSEDGLAKVRSGFVVDVLHPCNSNAPNWVDAGVVQPIDTSRLKHWNDVIPSMKHIADRDGQTYFAPMDWGQTSVTYRTDMVDFPDGEESWSILWDERYSGKIGMIASEGDAWWCAAIYAGVPFDQIETEENIQKVADILREQVPMVRMYSDDMTTVEQALAAGELVAAMTWNSSAVILKSEDVPVKFAAPKEGALTWVCGAMIFVDAPHVDKAHDVIDSLLSPESGRFLIDDYGYGHSNIKSFDLVSEERLAELGLSRNPDDILGAGKFQIPTSDEFTSQIATLFAEITAGY